MHVWPAFVTCRLIAHRQAHSPSIPPPPAGARYPQEAGQPYSPLLPLRLSQGGEGLHCDVFTAVKRELHQQLYGLIGCICVCPLTSSSPLTPLPSQVRADEKDIVAELPAKLRSRILFHMYKVRWRGLLDFIVSAPLFPSPLAPEADSPPLSSSAVRRTL